MQQTKHFGDHKGRCRDADKRDCHRLSREVVTPALVSAEGKIRGVFVRDPRSVSVILFSLNLGNVGPEFFRRAGIRQRMHADRVEILRGSAKRALDDAEDICRRQMRRAGFESKPQNASRGSFSRHRKF